MRALSALRPLIAAGSLVVATLAGWPSPARAAGETCDGKPATLLVTSSTPVEGTAGDDVIVATTSDAVTIDGLGGDDTICGGRGDDDISGGTGDDTILGNGGADVLAGESTFQTSPTSPGADNDTISGGTGADMIVDDWGDDHLAGDAGVDTVRLGVETDDPVDDGCETVLSTARLSVADGSVTGFGTDTLTGFARYVGGVHQSTLIGTPHSDTFRSGPCGSARLVGKGGPDHLRAESKFGGQVTGGAGDDQIVVAGHYAVGAGSGDDKIRLEASNFATTDMSTVDGGSGTDSLQDASYSYDKIALLHGLSRGGRVDIGLRRVENAEEIFPELSESSRIVLIGTNGRNVLVGPTAKAEDGHKIPTLLRGLQGNDRLVAHHGDTADGGPGHDVCRAQHRIACEAR